MSPINLEFILFFLGLFTSLSQFSLVKAAAAAAAVKGHHETAIKRRLRKHNTKATATDSAVFPRRTRSNNEHQEGSNKFLESFLRKQTHPLEGAGGGVTLLTSSTAVVGNDKRQIVEDSDLLLQCEDNQKLFRVEVTTDYYPEETSWELVDAMSGATVLEKDDFDIESSLYVENRCLESNLCYQFTIYDSYGLGSFFFGDPGSYKVEYDNLLIKEGGLNFGANEESEVFGDGCVSLPSSTPTDSQKPTIFPSKMPSTHPTDSQKPTAFPSRMPSAHPTNSQKPTAFPSTSSNPSLQPSFPPSFSPSLSFEPTSSPTELQDFISYNKDDSNRRFFPSPFLREDASTTGIVASYHTWPNCSAVTDGDRVVVGCVSIPKSLLLATPSWAGTIHSGKTPICKRGKCDLQIPMTNNALQIDVVEAHFGNTLQSRAKVELLPQWLPRLRVILAADVNGDGLPDIIIGNDYGKQPQLLMNQGNGDFKEVAGAISHHWWNTRVIGVGDMNNDGFPDLIISGDYGYYGENGLLLNQRDGTFEYAPVVIPGDSSDIVGIAIADVNSDGLLDLIFLIDRSWHLQVLLNQGDSTFEEVTDAFSVDTSKTRSIAVADVDGDGHTDIILGNDETVPTQVLLNQGNGTFVDSIPINSASSDTTTKVIAVADLDGDGTIDIISSNDNRDNPIEVLLNQGNGTFVKGDVAIPFGVQFIPQTIAVADMDGDGRLDILVGTSEGLPNYLLQNQGRGDFGMVAFDELAEDDKANTLSITVSDVNGDGRVDVIIGNSGSDPIQVLLNKKVGEYLEVLDFFPTSGDSSQTEDIAVADLDGDGLPDLVVVNLNSSWDPNQVLLNQGDGTFQEVISDVSSPGDGSWTHAVAVGDLNGDGLPDIVIGNFGKNRLMLNQGDGVFRESDLFSHGDGYTFDLTLADVNGDGHLDILVVNLGPEQSTTNQLLLNQGNGTFVEIDGAIPGNHLRTEAIAVADFNNDTLIDIVIGTNQLLLNQGNDTFQEIEGAIPGNYNTRPIAVADVNGDGFIDIIVGNSVLLLNRGNATFEEKVNAFPSSDDYSTYDIAVGDVDGDGHPDLLIGNHLAPNQLLLNRGDGTFKEEADMIPFGKFQTRAVAFADFNNDGRLDIAIGNSAERNQLLLFSECLDGAVPLHGSSWCFPCPNFMGRSTVVGTPVCRECPPDHIQDSDDNEQCSPEPCSSFQERQLGQNTCTPCPDGKFYNNSVIRSENQPSSFLQNRCAPCEAGTFYSNDVHATAVDQCIYCPPRLSSPMGGTSCSYCNEEYMLNSTFKGSLLEAFVNAPDEETCLKCPPNAKCDVNTTLETLGVPQKYWRDSMNTSVLYSCDDRSTSNPGRCIGTSAKNVNTSPDDYCAEGYHGPLCKLCEEENKYFHGSDGKCVDCNQSPLLALKATAFVLALLIGYFVIRFWGKRFQSLRSRGFQTKVKILISFYQVAATFRGVYGMRLHEDVAGILDFISYLSFGLFDLFAIPAECVGSKKDQLLLIILAPIFLIIIAGVWLFIVALVKHGNWKNQFLNVALVTFYLALPGVCNSIFSVIRCEHFVTSDDPEEYSSYIKDDFSIECDRSDPGYAFLLHIFFGSLVLWPVLVNTLWIYLIARIWRPVRTHRITPLANACRFLWRDYQPSMMFWDIIDMVRKIILTGVIACIDMRASTEVVRLIIAGVISFVYGIFLAMCRPYKRADDYYLAVISNILLTCCFLMGIITNICGDDGYDSCKEMIGFESEYTASVAVVVLTLSMLVVSILLFLGLMFLTITHPVLRLKSGEKPNLDLDAESNCECHAFFSHVWSTGQAKSHAIVRKMQLIMPSLRIWLDVDDIESSGGNLEQAVSESAVFLVFVSKDYFASKNCRREIYAAILLGKPVIAIYEGDKSVLESMMNECRRCCQTDDDTLSKILHHLEENSIQWVDENIFSAKALNRISTMLLSNLPYYQAHPHKLEAGVHVPGELGFVRLTSAVNLIVCRSNEGSSEVAHELMSLAGNNLTVTSELKTSLLSEGTVDTSSAAVRPCGKHQVKKKMILYLNKETFEHDAEDLTDMLKHAISQNIEVILLHELDSKRKGCAFDNFFHQTPLELLEEPYKIYSRGIAVPLYGCEDYRELGLKRLLCKLGAEKVSEGMWSRVSKSLRGGVVVHE